MMEHFIHLLSFQQLLQAPCSSYLAKDVGYVRVLQPEYHKGALAFGGKQAAQEGAGRRLKYSCWLIRKPLKN